MTNPRIAIAGFQHETNCFGTAKAGLSDFEMADSWPALLQGDAVLTETHGMNLPIAGFADACKGTDVELIPILWCSAEPSAHVTDHAFDTICDMILAGLDKAGPLDGIYLDLHGAMVTESHDDGEGEILRRIRAQVGPDIPIVVSLDLHANVSPEMVERSSYISIFRTYPHLDMAETGARCLPVLQRLLNGEHFHKAFRQIPYLIPLHAQYTGSGACKELYDSLPSLEQTGVLADIALGFTAADLPNTRPSCVVYGKALEQAALVGDQIVQHFEKIEAQIDHAMLPLSEIDQITERSDAKKPIVLADVQDNPGAGGSSDTTGLLTALANAEAQGVLMGLFCDPEVARCAHSQGLGSVLQVELGGKSGLEGQEPFVGTFEVIALSDGTFPYTGEMYGGGFATMGKTAALKLKDTKADINLVVTSIRNQCLDLAQFTHLGLEPREYRVICVKSTIHFRADFEQVASAIHSVASPGGFPCDLKSIRYENLHSEVRTHPK